MQSSLFISFYLLSLIFILFTFRHVSESQRHSGRSYRNVASVFSIDDDNEDEEQQKQDGSSENNNKRMRQPKRNTEVSFPVASQQHNCIMISN